MPKRNVKKIGKLQLYEDVAYSKNTGFPTTKLFYGRVIEGKLRGKRFVYNKDSIHFLARKKG